MGPKRKPQQTLRPPPGPRAGAGRGRGRPRQRPAVRRPRSAPRLRTNSRPRNTYTDWFMLATFQIQHNARPGLLGEFWLHPIALPNTPYSAACANYTHRREHDWAFRVYITTTSVAGARVAAIALTDPTYAGGLPLQAVWGAVANGRGTMVSSMGNQTRSTAFRIRGSTNTLSNANPPLGNNMLGYSDGILLIYCLQAPIGLSSDTQLNCTILARCSLSPINPIPGFLHSQAPIFQPTQGDDGGAPDFMLLFPGPDSGQFGPNDLMDNEGWCLNHSGDAWLAGGYYFLFKGAGGPVSTVPPAQGQSTAAYIYGVPKIGSVYTSPQLWNDWTTNNDFLAKPIYFSIFRSPISGTVTLVGFTNFEHATAQASGNTGMVPSGAELCISYHSPPTWGQFLPNRLRYNSDVDASGPLPSGAANYRYATFFEVASTPPPLGRPVYTTQHAITDAMWKGVTPASMQSYSLATAPPLPGFKTSLYDQPFGPLGIPQSHMSQPTLQQHSMLTPHQLATSPNSWGQTTNNNLQLCKKTYTSSIGPMTPRYSTEENNLSSLIGSQLTPTLTQLNTPSSLMSSPGYKTTPMPSASTILTPSTMTSTTLPTNLESSSRISTTLSGVGLSPQTLHPHPSEISMPSTSLQANNYQTSYLQLQQELQAARQHLDLVEEDSEQEWSISGEDSVDEEPPDTPPTLLSDLDLQTKLQSLQASIQKLQLEATRRSRSLPDLADPQPPSWAVKLKNALKPKKK